MIAVDKSTMNMLKKIVLLSILLLTFFLSFPQSNSTINSGEKLFRDNCAACHKLGRDLIGPDLTGINSKRPRIWLLNFIKNSQSVIKSNDNYAIELYKQYKQVIMPEIQLSEVEIDSLLNYISRESNSGNITLQQQLPVTTVPSPSVTVTFRKKMIRLGVIFIILAILFLPVLYIILRQRFKPKELLEYDSFSKFILLLISFLTKRVSMVFYILNGSIIFILIISLNYQAITAKKYKIQPQAIEFSHTLHCDTFSTDCIFCHNGAENDFFAGLPGIRNCMKCHNYISEGKKYGKKELLKLILAYKSTKEIHWATGFRYNDYVHFNHSIHYVTAKISCRKCHEEPENVEIIKSRFSMRWCIDCHKTSEINKFDNYYKKTSDTLLMTKAFKVSETGGLDCSSCHY